MTTPELVGVVCMGLIVAFGAAVIVRMFFEERADEKRHRAFVERLDRKSGRIE